MTSTYRLSKITTDIARLESRLATLRSEEQSVRQLLEQVRDLAVAKWASVTGGKACLFWGAKTLVNVIQEWDGVYCLVLAMCVCTCVLSLSLVIGARAFYIGSKASTVSQTC